MDLPVDGERKAQHFLGRGFADAAGHRKNLGFRARTGGNGEARQRRQHIVDDHRRPDFSEARRALFGDHRDAAEVVESGARIVVAVHLLAGNGEERFARLDAAAVDGNAGDGLRHGADDAAADGRGKFLSRPQSRPAHLQPFNAARIAS
jgi:hypothetical protein